MADELTWQQRRAVENRGGRLLVSAAAGSGKTKVLVERLMGYMTDADDPANIDDFLIITFTKAAASELRAKISKALTERIAMEPTNTHLQKQFQRLYLAKISTIHSFCSDVLREYAFQLDVPGDFRMLEDKESEAYQLLVLDMVLAATYDHIHEDPDITAFIDTQGEGRSDKNVPELVLKIYESAKCHMDPEGWLERCIKEADVSHLTDASQSIWGKYVIEDLFSTIDAHCAAVQKMALECDEGHGLTIMQNILWDILFQLTRIRKATTWDEIHRFHEVDYSNLNAIKNVKKDAAIYERAKFVRQECMKDMEGKLKPFGNSSSQVLADLQQITPAVRGLVSLVRKFDKAYNDFKMGLHVVDYSDLEHKTLDLFLGKNRNTITSIARDVGSRYREIMVDEYQDSNEVQDRMFNALTEKRKNLFMVGDVKQSIYQFRLADPGIFLKKYAEFADSEKAVPGEGRRIILSNNFRSGCEVIEAVNDVFSNCMSEKLGGLTYGKDEALWEGVPKGTLPNAGVELHVLSTEHNVYAEEAEYVADKIVDMLDGKHYVRNGKELRPIEPKDIAILLRSPKNIAAYYHEALLRRGIPTVSSTEANILESEEIEWLRSLLQTINNPRQDIPLIAALTGPIFGFTADDLANIKSRNKDGYFYDALIKSDSEKATHFLQVLSQLRQIARVRTLPELIEGIFDLTQADSVYAAMDNGQVRSGNLQQFYQFVVRYDAATSRNLPQLIKYLTLCDKDGIPTDRADGSDGCVQITSIHKSKGLEYPVVFLCALSKTFNLRDTYKMLLANQHLGLGLLTVEDKNRTKYRSLANRAISAKMKTETIAEELRILYVAMTRPTDRLIMTYSQKGLEKFLYEMMLKMRYYPGEYINSTVGSIGHWVMYTALMREEARDLFAIIDGIPAKTKKSKYPWLIRSRSELSRKTKEEEAEPNYRKPLLPEGALEDLKIALSFVYPNMASTKIPSKQTATQRKGKPKEEEVLENTPLPKEHVRTWRKPTSGSKADGRSYGNATHAAMQYIKYENCTDKAAVIGELERLERVGYLTPEQRKLVDADRIAKFFASEIGQKLRSGEQILREFKFSILDDAENYADGITGEQILLQGVVDCALLEDEGITVIDFKTDHVSEDTVGQRTEKYRLQVETYCNALSRIFEKPVIAKGIYFFSINRFVWL